LGVKNKKTWWDRKAWGLGKRVAPEKAEKTKKKNNDQKKQQKKPLFPWQKKRRQRRN